MNGEHELLSTEPPTSGRKEKEKDGQVQSEIDHMEEDPSRGEVDEVD
jgi:hypothetical protein